VAGETHVKKSLNALQKTLLQNPMGKILSAPAIAADTSCLHSLAAPKKNNLPAKRRQRSTTFLEEFDE
jgi:hypothetical protein